MDNPELRFQLESHHRESYGWALSCCARDPVAAESVLQVAYLKVLEGKARYCGRSTFKTWLFSVIRQTAAGARRRKFLHRLKLSTYAAQSNGLSAPGEGLDETVYRSEIQRLFRRALVRLPLRQS